jgi:hypothetical protein
LLASDGDAQTTKNIAKKVAITILPMFFILILLSYVLVAGAKKKVTGISSAEEAQRGGKRKAEPSLTPLLFSG